MFTQTVHVEAIILMTKCGSDTKKWGLTTTYSGLEPISGSKTAKKLRFLTPKKDENIDDISQNRRSR